ncbi:MAG: peptidase T [Bacteroidales bacterium]|nr:peptidase T [Bacteroidales bacterium]MDD5974166.1 peptidase T [Bacteroidales bacterium]MDY5193798.1 peptidase T [Candidatus Aphodosoma sp.]
MRNFIDRFIEYVGYATTSDENTGMTPSTPGQMVFAKQLVKELTSLGLEEVSVDDNGYVMATLPSNCSEKIPTIGFIAHLDTAPDLSGKHVKPRIVKNYDGGDIFLDEEKQYILSPTQFPELLKYKGQDIIVTNGHTLLGADDKAGVTEIISAVEYLLEHPEIKHGKVRIAFTPDEEIGQGAHHFDVKKFGCDWAYTIDGGEIGELEYENFNAAGASIIVHGCNVHPGYAKGKMINSIKVAEEYTQMIPVDAPENTEGYEGFYHLICFNGTVEETKVNYIIRDHSRELFEQRKQKMLECAKAINDKYGKELVSIEIKDQYYNMREKVEPVKHIVDLAFEAMKLAGITPSVKPIRGGTDGAQLSFKGLPCPNIFTGGHNFHGRYEYIPVQSMEKAINTIVNIIKLVK